MSKIQEKILICTLTYSSNLGDGLIGQCLELIIKKNRPDLQVLHIDLAGRQSFAEGRSTLGTKRKLLFYTIPKVFKPLATLVAWPFLMAPKIKRSWDKVDTSGRFSFIFGGGQIFSDLALNFPLKTALAFDMAASYDAKVAVNAVGVSNNWTFLGKRLFSRWLNDPRTAYISVRDKESWKSLIGSCPEVKAKSRQTIDPGVWAAELYENEIGNLPQHNDIRIGIGITHPGELASHSEVDGKFAAENLVRFWIDLARRVIADGKTPVFFTNGADEDETFLDEIMNVCHDAGPGKIERLKMPESPQDLVVGIASFDGMIGHRLHANIAAYSLGIPSVALGWDKKIFSFMTLAGRDKWCTDTLTHEVYDLLLDSLNNPISVEDRNNLKSLAYDDVSDMLEILHPIC